MRPGHIDNRGRQFFRCPECEDSDNLKKAHAFVDLHGNTYCYRCQHSGKLSTEAYIDLILGEVSVEEALEFSLDISQQIKYTEGRSTLLTKYQGNGSEAFSMRDQRGNLIGWHERYPNKFQVNSGKRGLNWQGADDGEPLVSSSQHPIILVEGPYDVIRPDYVVCYGQPAYATLKHLKYHHVWVFPDPDLIDTKTKRIRFVRNLELANSNLCFIKGLIVGNNDPDKATITNFVSLSEAMKYVKNET